MNIIADKEDVLRLLLGSSPSVDLFEDVRIKKLGFYNGSLGVWHWNEDAIYVLDKKDIYELYLLCKNSRKK